MWAVACDAPIAGLSEARLAAFFSHFPCSCLGEKHSGKEHIIKTGARSFLRHLREREIAAPKPMSDPAQGFALLSGFREWMTDQRGVCSATLDAYSRVVVDLLRTLGEHVEGYSAGQVRGFVLERAGRHGRDKAKQVMTATRVFLRFCVASRGCRESLVDAVPTIAKRRLADLPRYLGSEQVERVIAACDSNTPVGARDRAVVLMLARMGLRAGEVCALRLSDIDWSDATLKVRGKPRRETRLPLPQDAGDAIIQYLETARPPGGDDHVFVRAVAPVRRMNSTAVSLLVHRAIDRAGIKASRRGAHILRHSAATTMVRGGASLESIAAVLRHRSIETTTIYAKVDVGMLRELAQPWPGEVAPC